MLSLRMEMDVLNGQSSSSPSAFQPHLIERGSGIGIGIGTCCWGLRGRRRRGHRLWVNVPHWNVRVSMCSCWAQRAECFSFFRSLTLICLLVAVTVAVDVLNFSRCLNLGVFAFTAAGCTAYPGNLYLVHLAVQIWGVSSGQTYERLPTPIEIWFENVPVERSKNGLVRKRLTFLVTLSSKWFFDCLSNLVIVFWI